MMNTLDAGQRADEVGGWFHTLSPFLVRLTDDFGVRWYGFSYLLAFVLAYVLLRMLSKRGVTPIPYDRILDAMMILGVGVMVGGRLGYVVLYDPRLLIEFGGSAPWWGVLRLSQGGMASHGGFVGVIVGAWWISRGFKADDGTRVGGCPSLHVMDMCALVAPLGLMLGRIANFINGELLGKIVAGPGESAPWYSVRYPQEVLERPDEIEPHAFEQIVGISSRHLLPGEQYWEIGFARVLEKIQGGDAMLRAELSPWINSRYPTQLMQGFFDGLLVFVVVWLIARKPRVPGVVGAWMLIVYALGRIPMDMVRLSDVGVSQFGPLTRGQGYSLLMLIAGISVLIVVTRRGAEKMGGWGVSRSAQESESGADSD